MAGTNAAAVAVLRLELKQADAYELVRSDELLARSELVAALGDRAAEVLALGFPRRIPADAEIFQARQSGDSLYFVLDGQVTLCHGEGSQALEIGTAHKGDFFGEAALLEDGVRRLTALARGAAQVLELPRAALAGPLQSLPALRALLSRVRDARARAEEELTDFLDRW